MSRFAWAAALALGIVALAVPARAAAPWLFVSDVHFDPGDSSKVPPTSGHDTNTALLNSTLAAMQASDPNAPVVVIPGDFVAHHFRGDQAVTIEYLARRFDAAFPKAQFLIALGNNDSSCGDYAPAVDRPFLREVAHAWAPLVNRNGAAPDFERTFAHDGSYAARLPVPGLRAVVYDDVFEALRFSPACSTASAPDASLADLAALLRAGDPKTRNLLLLHIPPGIDAYSTAQLSGRTVIVPFLQPDLRDRLLHAIVDPKSRVAAVVTGHTHRLDFRIAPLATVGDGVPMLLVPSISPVYGNAPAFLEAPVAADGTIGDVSETAFSGGRWQRTGDLASIGIPTFTNAHLQTAQQRIYSDRATRERWVRLYDGGLGREIDAANFRPYWCAAQFLRESSYELCIGEFHVGPLSQRGIEILAFGVALLISLTVAAFSARRLWMTFGPPAYRRAKAAAAATAAVVPDASRKRTAARAAARRKRRGRRK